ncbi:unnamed protein product [Acanthoscelides obtectus]|uniref:Uncharacterized protein n=1 Tax=Acanthoscelides obtectus TaxID=200917 RepID=A0A9P0PTX4_ACAOB|nr:unnamed protein product [Acanthoscelides obtectus]CAK1637893.1 hypothetical protein AOBTE_LOCUS10268 [Acanthoscelides obtectus]
MLSSSTKHTFSDNFLAPLTVTATFNFSPIKLTIFSRKFAVLPVFKGYPGITMFFLRFLLSIFSILPLDVVISCLNCSTSFFTCSFSSVRMFAPFLYSFCSFLNCFTSSYNAFTSFPHSSWFRLIYLSSVVRLVRSTILIAFAFFLNFFRNIPFSFPFINSVIIRVCNTVHLRFICSISADMSCFFFLTSYKVC